MISYAVSIASFGHFMTPELADALDARGLCLRGGLHCAPCMHRYLGTQGTVRASVGPYSTLQEMDILAAEVQAIRDKT